MRKSSMLPEKEYWFAGKEVPYDPKKRVVLAVVVMYDASRLAMILPSTISDSVTPVKVTAM